MTMAAVAGSGLAVILGGFGAFMLIRDLDRRRKTEHALTHGRELLQGIIDNIPVMITIYNPGLRDFRLNREFVRVLGWSTEAVRQVDLMEKCFPDPEYRKTARQYMQSLQPGWRDFRVTAKDGNVVESSWANIRLSDDTLIGIGIDIRERKKAEETLRRSEQLNMATLNALPAHIAVLDRGGTILMVNDAWTEFARCNGDPTAAKVSVGANYLGVCGQISGSLCPEADEALEGIQAVLDGRQSHFTMAYPCHSPDEQRWFLMNVVPLRAATGGAVVTHLDITDRRLAEEALHQAKEYAEHLLAVAGVIFVVLDEQGRIQILNRKGCEILGCSEAEAIGKDWINTFIPERLRPEIRRVFGQVAAGDLLLAEYYENPILSCDGQERLIAWHNTVLRDDLGKVFGVLSSGQDISAERKNLTALLESEERFRVMAETVPDILFTARPDGWWDYFNPRFYEYTGLTPDAAEGFGWIRALHPDDKERVQASWRQALETGEPLSLRYRLRAADGGFRWFQVRTRLIRSAAGEIVKWFGVTSDIDDLVRAEETSRESDRRKDEFLAMLGHELRNPLAPIRNAVHIIRRLNLPEPKLQWAQEMIDRQLTHLARLVDDLLDVSRIAQGKITLKKEPVELAAIIHQAVEVARPLVETRRHRLTIKLDQSVRLAGDPVRLSQVFLNLLDNAAKYTGEGGRIWLETELSGSEVAVRVRDTGVGIPANLLPRVFELFEQGERSLDRSQGGLGIGLTLVRHLVEMHGGRVEVKSAGLGQGAEFTVWLPVLTELEPMVQAENGASQPRADRCRVRVLIVDDDFSVAESMAVLLQLEGHEVSIAQTGQEALALARTFRPQVVILDIGLPVMDGYEVARRLRQQPETQQVVLIALTGYGQEQAQAEAKAAGFDHHLIKPVDPEVLSALLVAGPTWEGTFSTAAADSGAHRC
jgi:PAS domain S-box-containing protein